ncbi:hypothetical protein GYMLUDRAFT_239473 [Collybiopsis luxurians FD-317 M1]|nr:hypothetical protein GYMLUDRAFT_239473 [Collybiopsis luxurians FD-317 M1]
MTSVSSTSSPINKASDLLLPVKSTQVPAALKSPRYFLITVTKQPLLHLPIPPTTSLILSAVMLVPQSTSVMTSDVMLGAHKTALSSTKSKPVAASKSLMTFRSDLSENWHVLA